MCALNFFSRSGDAILVYDFTPKQHFSFKQHFCIRNYVALFSASLSKIAHAVLRNRIVLGSREPSSRRRGRTVSTA